MTESNLKETLALEWLDILREKVEAGRLLLVQFTKAPEADCEEGTETYCVAMSFVIKENAPPPLAMGDAIPPGGCGCRHNGIPIMQAQCAIHGRGR